MTAKQYLSGLARIQLHIEKLTAEVEEMRARLEAPAMLKTSERVQSSVEGDRLSELVAQIVDADRKRQEELLKYQIMRDNIVTQILGLEDTQQARLLYDHYVEQKPLKDIAEEYHYNYYWICHVHGLALKSFSEKYKDRKQPQL